VGADPAGFVFVPNATTGINSVLRSLDLEPGDEILVTDHGYEACRLAAEHEASRSGARVTVARIPVPVQQPHQVIEAIKTAVTPATRYAIVDHITSPTALVFPIEDIVATLADRGVGTIVDGAHAPGMVELDIESIDSKWRNRVHPVVISHGAGARGPERFHAMFDWTGTDDPTPWLTVPTALDTIAAMVPGGWPEVRDHNRNLALAMRDRVVAETAWKPTGPPEMIGSMSAHLTPWSSEDPQSRAEGIALQLMSDHRVVVAVPWRRGEPDLLLRVSAHLHTTVDDLEPLIAALGDF
jgi:isopenicillin-N epimerase